MSSRPTPDTETLLANADWVRELARRLVRDPHAAEDIAQDAWASALQHPPLQAHSWNSFLRSIVTNLARRKHRDDRHRELREERAARNEALASTLDVVERLATHRVVVEAVESLDEPYRTAILLRYFDSLPPRAIAARLDVPVKTVDTRLQRGLQQLRAKLDREFGGERQDRLRAVLIVPFAPRAQFPHPWRAVGKAIFVSSQIKVAACVVLIALGLALWWRHDRGTVAPNSSSALGFAPGESTTSRPSAASPLSPANGEDMRVEAAVQTIVDASHEDELELRGRVLDSREQPVPDAQVEISEVPIAAAYIFQDGDRPQDVHVATRVTDEAGAFSLPLSIGRPYKVLVDARGYVSTGDSWVYPGKELTLHVYRAARIRGRVLSSEDHAPIADARVSFMSNMQPWHTIDVQTDSGGAFTIADANAGKGVYVTVAATHRAIQRVVLDVHEGETITRDIELTVGHSVSGIVRDSVSKRGIAGAFVFANDYEVDWPHVVTDANGRYVLDNIASDKSAYVRVRAAGHPDAERLVRMDHGPVEDVDFDLTPSRIWHGRIVTTDGAPVAGAWVSAMSSVWGESEDVEGVRAGADGKFEFDHLRSDVHHLLIAHKERCGRTAVHMPDPVADAEDKDLDDIVLLRSALLSGVVVDEDGGPIADVTVQIRSHGRDRFALATVSAEIDNMNQDWRELRTDPQGRFAFAELTAGPCSITFHKEGFAETHQQSFELAEGQVRRDLRVVVPSRLGIEGHVVDADGVPYAGADVCLQPEASDVLLGSATTDARGWFRIGGIEEGRYSVHANPRYEDDGSLRTIGGTQRGVAAGTRDALVMIPHTTWVEGVVVGPDDVPVPHAMVYGYDDRGVALGTNVADGKGHFRYKVAVDSTTDLAASWTTEGQGWNNYQAIEDEGSRAHRVGVIAGRRDLVLKLGPRP